LGGRHEELLEYLDKSGAALFALLTRLTLRQDVAEELMQELFIKLSRSRGPDHKAGTWDAYARKAAINLAFDWRRRRKRTPLQQLEQVPEPVATDGSPLGGLIRSEELQETLDAIGRLKKASREALIRRYIQQESYERIAEQMGTTSHRVRAICSRAVNHLRVTLGSNHRQST
jgi:RNA polymerase sigma-70 factor (ECF subfamily)